MSDKRVTMTNVMPLVDEYHQLSMKVAHLSKCFSDDNEIDNVLVLTIHDVIDLSNEKFQKHFEKLKIESEL